MQGLKLGLYLGGSIDINYLLSLIGRYGVAAMLFDNSPGSVFQEPAGTTVSSIGDVVGKLEDQSGGGNHITQATVKPILRAGPLLEFDGTNDYLSGANPFTGDELTLIWCGKMRTAADSKYFLTFGDTGNDANYLALRSASTNQYKVEPAGTVLGTSIFVTATQTDLNIISFRASSSVNELSLNQTRVQSGVPAAYDFSAVDIFSVGALVRTSAGFFSGIDNNYVFAINTYLTDNELAQAEAYIAGRCGVTL